MVWKEPPGDANSPVAVENNFLPKVLNDCSSKVKWSVHKGSRMLSEYASAMTDC